MAIPPGIPIKLATASFGNNYGASSDELDNSPERLLKLTGAPESWVIVKCANRTGRRYEPTLFDQVTRLLPAVDSFNTLYVGIDIQTLLPVFSHKRISPDTDADFSDNFRTVRFRSKPANRDCTPSKLVVHEYMCTRGALGFTKRVSLGDSAAMQVVGRQKSIDVWKDQVKSTMMGHPVEPLRHPEHCGLPIYLSTIDGYTDTAYPLRLPRLTKITLTPAFLQLARDVQNLLNCDNIHLNVVIMAICVWGDHELDPNLRLNQSLGEMNVDHITKMRSDVSMRNMLNFVANWPHYLRFHELFKLVTYMHPYRFINARIKHNEGTLTSSDWVETTFPQWESAALEELKRAGLEANHKWCRVLPSSLLGSRLTRPADANDFAIAVPDAELHQDLAIPDIHIIGHPAYPVGEGEETRIITPLSAVSPALFRKTMVQHTIMNEAITTHAGLKENGELGNLRLISGDQLTIFAPPRPLDPTLMPASHVQRGHNVEQSGRQVEKEESQVRRVNQDMSEIQSWVAALPRHVMDKFKKEFNDRLAKAQEAGVCFGNITCDDLLLPTWPEPSQYLSSDAKERIRSAIESHLKKEPRLRAFDILASLDLNTAKADTVKGVIATAVAATKPLCRRNSPNPRDALMGIKDLGGHQLAIFTRQEVFTALSKKGVEPWYQSIIWGLLADGHFHDRDFSTRPEAVITHARLGIERLLMSRLVRCVEAFDAISKSLD